MSSGEKWIPIHCGDAKLFGDGGVEYPCVRRYRHRRLLTFLWLQGFQATHESMLSESDAIMWVPHLQEMMLGDQWQDAKLYLYRFLSGATSVEAMVLTRVLDFFGTLGHIVVGGGEVVEMSKQNLDHKRTICHAQIRLRSIILKAQQARASIDWERVKERATDILDELAFATPELKGLTFMPRGSMKPHNVLPIGFGFRRRYRPKKQTRPPKSPAVVAKNYLARRRRLPASSDPSQEIKCDRRLTLIKALDWMADILDDCLQAGKLEVHPVQTTETESGHKLRSPVLQTISSGLTCPAIYTGIPSVANAGTNAGKLASHVPPTDAPLVQPVCNILTSNCGNSGIGSMANAGSITAPLSQNMVGSLAGPVINPVLTSVENAETQAFLLTAETESGPRKMRRLNTSAVNLGRTQGRGHHLKDINSSLDDVSSSVNDLCLITNPHNKDNVKRRIHSTLGKIKDSVALLVAQTAGSAMAGVAVPLFESNVVTDVTGVGQAASTPLVPEIQNFPASDPTENTTDSVNDSQEDEEVNH